MYLEVLRIARAGWPCATRANPSTRFKQNRPRYLATIASLSLSVVFTRDTALSCCMVFSRPINNSGSQSSILGSFGPARRMTAWQSLAMLSKLSRKLVSCTYRTIVLSKALLIRPFKRLARRRLALRPKHSQRFPKSSDFFALPDSVKDQLAWRSRWIIHVSSVHSSHRSLC